MTVFDDFANAILPADYWRTDERNPLGVTKGPLTRTSVIIDEGGETSFTGDAPVQADDVLIYGMAGSPLASHACVGGWIKVYNGLDSRTFKIVRWDVGRDQDLQIIDHFEVYGQEVGPQ